ncbi:MAG: DMT family transporter [Burkholderiales bacterium]
MLHADSARNRLIGIGLVSSTFLFFALLDAGAKWLVRTLPVVEVVWLRFASHVIFAAVLLAPRHGLNLVRTRRPGLQLIRSLFMPVMTALNFWALQYLQLAETGAIQFTVPILIALMSGPLLGERLDAGRWAAIAIGFVGILVILRPGTQGFHPALLLALINAVLYALFNLMTRKLAAHDPPEATQFLSALGAVIVMAPFAFAVWQTPATTLEWTMACLIGVAGGLGHYFLAIAHRFAPASVLGPFLYQQIVWMVLFGYLVFGDVPAGAVVLGAAIVISSGLYLLYRERRGGG